MTSGSAYPKLFYTFPSSFWPQWRTHSRKFLQKRFNCCGTGKPYRHGIEHNINKVWVIYYYIENNSRVTRLHFVFVWKYWLWRLLAWSVRIHCMSHFRNIHIFEYRCMFLGQPNYQNYLDGFVHLSGMLLNLRHFEIWDETVLCDWCRPCHFGPISWNPSSIIKPYKIPQSRPINILSSREI